MKTILENIDYELVYDEVYKIDIAKDVINDLTEKPDKQILVKFLITYYGYELLNQPSIRHLILNSLEDKQINLCCTKLKRPPTKYKYDTALLLSNYKWNSTSPLPEILNEVMDYAIPENYLPFNIDQIRLPKIEKVYSIKNESLFDYQIDISNKIIHFLNSAKKRTMVQMPTGSGKTKTTISSIINFMNNDNKPCEHILWLSHTSELCEQSHASCKKNWSFMGNGLLYLYRLYGHHSINQYNYSNGVIFASLQKIYSLYKNDDALYDKISQKCQLIIFDEAHKALAPTYKKIIDNIMIRSNKCKLIGLSATPGRGSVDEFNLANKSLTSLFNNNLISLEYEKKNPIIVLREQGILSHLKRKSIKGLSGYKWNNNEMEYFKENSEIAPSVLKGLATNKERNDNIIEAIINEVNNGMQCLVFACTSRHAQVLSSLLSLNTISAKSITSEMTKLSRYRAIESFKDNSVNVLVNFGILTTGFDAPKIGAVFITRPTNSIILYSQMLGRGLRGLKVGGNKECLLYDVIDNFKDYGNQNEIYDYFDGYWS